MKLSLVLSTITFLSCNLYAETCAEKISAIETKMGHATKHGNKAELKGLETALAEAKANCTDEKLIAAQNAKIKDKEEDVAEAQKELEEAKKENKSQKKIQKKQEKLDKEMKELEEIKK